MKTNTIQVITATVAAGLIAGFGSIKVSGDYVSGLTAAVGFFAVAAIVALAVADYRRLRSYNA